MKPPCGGAAAAPSPWADIESFGDCFENVLAHLDPADVASCRLVSRNWCRATGLLLQQLQPAAGVEPELVAAAFPHVACLQLTAKPSGSPRGSDSSGALFGRPIPTAAANMASAEAGGLPQLGALRCLRRLRRLRLQGALVAGSALDCAELAHLAGMPALDELEAACLELHNAAALQQLGAQLTRLHLQGHSLPGGQGSLPALLAPLHRLAHLHFSCYARPSGSSGGWELSSGSGGGAASSSSPFASAGQLAGLSQLTSLVTIELSSPDAASDAVCWEVATGPLPRLRRLAIHRCASFGHAAPAISDAGVELLAARLGGQLTSLALSGHARISDAGVEAIAGMGQLQQLELRLGGPATQWPWQAEVSDVGLATLAALSRLESLHLGGGVCSLGEQACATFARHLRGLTALHITDCPTLGDNGLFRLAPLAPGLLRLGLSGCGNVTDIALAAVLRAAGRLTHLELAGCHRNITGTGLQVLSSLRRLTHLDLSGCDAITDEEIEELLPAFGALEHLDLSDCAVSDHACALLAAHAPRLRWLSLEHCCDVSSHGLLHLSAGLPLLRELFLCGSGVSEGAVAQLRRTPRGKRVQIELFKACWWLPEGAAVMA